MSSGKHVPHRYSAEQERELDRALADPRVRAYLATRKAISRAYDLPYLAGYSRDGRTVYIDRHIPKLLKGFDPTPYLIRHETVEYAIERFLGRRYLPAHHLATAAEHRMLRADRHNPAAYESGLRPYIKATEHEPLGRTPPDLDLQPYRDMHETALLRRIRAAA